jgi:hypothetical protein
MIGPDGGQQVVNLNKETWGILPRAAEYLLGELADKAQEGQLSYQVKASFLQIYNENIYDLLRDSGPLIDDGSVDLLDFKNKNKEPGLKIREIPLKSGKILFIEYSRTQFTNVGYFPPYVLF